MTSTAPSAEWGSRYHFASPSHQHREGDQEAAGGIPRESGATPGRCNTGSQCSVDVREGVSKRDSDKPLPGATPGSCAISVPSLPNGDYQ